MKHSFTVTELLVAIAIIVILAGILIGGLGYAGRRADQAKTIAAIQELSQAFEEYRAEKGFYPPCKSNNVEVKFYRKDTDKVLTLVLGSNEFKFVNKAGKPFLELANVSGTTKEPFIDTWGTTLRYQCPGTHNKASFDLWSYGPDKKSSTDNDKLDDITNWDNASQQ